MKEVRRSGPEGIIHKLRGRESNRKHEEGIRDRVIELYQKRYVGFGPTLLSEKLLEEKKIEVNRETLRQWLLEERLWERQRKGVKHLQWRERKECFGEMTQVDGSHHDWLEGRGPELVLMGYIDDATNRVFAKFYDYEGTLPAMDSFYGYQKEYGLPHSIYIDRLKAYRGDGKPSLEAELAGQDRELSQFERALEDLGVEVIHAQSPQAKGRVERLFRTFQDRLIKEMRLAGVKTKEEANEFLKTYLPKFNRRFARQAKREVNLHREVQKGINLKQVLSIQTKRVLRNDNTIRHENKFYQIENRWNGRKPKGVVVEERMDGKLCLSWEGKELKYRRIEEQPRVEEPVKRSGYRSGKNPNSRPKMEHPWKRKSYEARYAA